MCAICAALLHFSNATILIGRIRHKLTEKLKELGEYSSEKTEQAMCSKVYD